MNQDIHPDIGALERLGIDVEISLPQDVMTSGKAGSVRFRTSAPRGYAFGDVESFINDYLIPTLKFYEQTLHQRALEVHKLGELLDTAEIDILNLRDALDKKDYSNALGLQTVNAEDDEEKNTLMRRIRDLEDEVEALRARPAASAAANPFAPAPAENTFTEEEVQNFINDAVKKRDQFYFENYISIDDHNAALREASANAGYSEEEMQNLLDAQAKTLQAAHQPEAEGDPLDAFLMGASGADESELQARLRVTLESYKELEEYCNQLEAAYEQATGHKIQKAGEKELPELTPEDL